MPLIIFCRYAQKAAYRHTCRHAYVAAFRAAATPMPPAIFFAARPVLLPPSSDLISDLQSPDLCPIYLFISSIDTLLSLHDTLLLPYATLPANTYYATLIRADTPPPDTFRCYAYSDVFRFMLPRRYMLVYYATPCAVQLPGYAMTTCCLYARRTS